MKIDTGGADLWPASIPKALQGEARWMLWKYRDPRRQANEGAVPCGPTLRARQ